MYLLHGSEDIQATAAYGAGAPPASPRRGAPSKPQRNERRAPAPSKSLSFGHVLLKGLGRFVRLCTRSRAEFEGRGLDCGRSAPPPGSALATRPIHRIALLRSRRPTHDPARVTPIAEIALALRPAGVRTFLIAPNDLDFAAYLSRHGRND